MKVAASTLELHLETVMEGRLESLISTAGGDAAVTYQAVLETGERYFVKTARAGTPFRMEALGLQRMASAADGVRVPQVYHVDDRCLVLEFLSFSSPAPEYQEHLGRALACTHRQTHAAFGFDEDHAIGMTPQKNQPWVQADSPSAWRSFWWTHRMEPLFQLLDSPDLRSFASRLEQRLEVLIPDQEDPPSLLHGDLWSGNIGADERGLPVMFDPAPYYGHREADLGMTRMFGGFSDEFYQAYTEAWPLKEGWNRRVDLYMLYHVMNHAVLFGGSYLHHVQRLLHELL